MNLQNHFDEIFKELNRTLAEINNDSIKNLIVALLDVERVFVAGAGRSGLVMKGFSMRLMHLGFEVYTVGETVTPAISDKDMFLIASGSGATHSLLANAENAKSVGAVICLLTTQENSSIGRLANYILPISAPSPKIEKNLGFNSIQPLGSLFEQSLMLTLDAIVLVLMDELEIANNSMFAIHANLE